jgi:hypothetical protein
MPNPWFRLYHEFADDPKVQMMPENMQRRLIMLFCSRCKGETLHETERAFHWRVTETELAETKALFMEKGFIDDKWRLLNWDRRQFLSDSSTDRVRRHRQALKQSETLHETVVPVTVTAPEQNRTEQKHKKPLADKSAVDLRFAPFLADIDSYWKEFEAHSSSPLPMDAAGGKLLKTWLKNNPKVDRDTFRLWLANMFKSDNINTSWNVREILSRIHLYADGPLNVFSRPVNGAARCS